MIPSGVDGADGDPDGDGMDNLSEYIADTNPRDAQSRLEISGISLIDAGATNKTLFYRIKAER